MRRWWMGTPVVWAVWLSSAVAQVAPLSVTLAPNHDCPSPHAVTPLLRLPVGCPSPWAGVLYTEDEHARIRKAGAQLNALTKAHRARADVAEVALADCKAQRDRLTREIAADVSRIEGQIQAIASLDAVEPPALWPAALVGGGLAAAGSLAGLIGDDRPTAILYGGLGAVGGALIGAGVAWLLGE